MIDDTTAHQDPLATLQPLLPAELARRMAALIRALFWASILLMVWQVASSLYGSMNLLFGTFIQYHVHAVFLLLFTVIQLVVCFLLFKLIWKARAPLMQTASRGANGILTVFLAALVLRAGLWLMLIFVSTPFRFDLYDTSRLWLAIPFQALFMLSGAGLLVGAGGVMALATRLATQSKRNISSPRSVWLFRVWLVVLALAFIEKSTPWVLEQPWLLGGLTPEQQSAIWIFTSYFPLTAIVPIIWSFALLLPLRRWLQGVAKETLCPNCWYDLRGNLGGGCPECGCGRQEVRETEFADTAAGNE